MRVFNRLSARKIETLSAPGKYPDGHLLFFKIAKPCDPSRRSNHAVGGRSWFIRYRAPEKSKKKNGGCREMGLGPYPAISLAKARELRDAVYLQIRTGADPLKEREARRMVVLNERNFGEFTTEYLQNALTGFRNEKHKWQWRQTLETHAKPLWKLSLGQITTSDVFGCLDPIWETKNETARRLRGRIERVLAAAKAQGFRRGENPASWENLKPLFEGRKKPVVTHHPALPYKEAPAFMRDLRALSSTSAKALELLILCASRSGEIRFARWQEFDLGLAKKWVVPAERMKTNKEHEVPLADRAIEILEGLKPGKPNALVFPGTKPSEPLSNTALLMCLRGLRPGYTTHGFRSTFSDWIGDETDFPRDLREFALAHKIPNEVEAAYRRSTGFEKRRKMMADWASYLTS
jgi:integrase